MIHTQPDSTHCRVFYFHFNNSKLCSRASRKKTIGLSSMAVSDSLIARKSISFSISADGVRSKKNLPIIRKARYAYVLQPRKQHA